MNTNAAPARTLRTFALRWAAAASVCVGVFTGAATAREDAPAPITPLAHVETRGEGPTTLVLVPGLGCDWSVWDAFMTRNAERYTMHAVTLPGFAGSAPPPTPADGSGAPWVDNAVGAIDAFIAERDLDAPIIVGHSMGGHIAMRFATERPERIGGAISVDGLPAIPLGSPTMTLVEREQLVNSLVAPQLRDMSDEQWVSQQQQWVRGMVTNPARADELAVEFLKSDRRVVTQYLLDLFRSDITPALANVGARTLLIGAVPPAAPDTNPALSRGIWAGVAERAPGATMVMLENCRHFIMEDRPATLDAIVESFVKGEDVSRHGDAAP